MERGPIGTDGGETPRSTRFGLLLTAVHDGATPAAQQLREHWQLTELAVGYGFDLVMAGQHVLPEGLRYYRPIPLLAWLATAFPTIRVGTGVLLLPLMRPVDVAEEIATLDAVTDGRVVFGVGLGYTDREFTALGIPRSERVARLEHGLALVRALWSGERTEHHGLFGDFTVERPIVRPVQRPHPPIWLAGQAPASVRRAARIADAWYPPPFLSHAELRRMAGLHATERAAAGRPPAATVPIRREVFMADTVERARTGAAPFALGRTKTYLEWGLRSEVGQPTAMHSETADNLGDRFLLGPPSRIAGDLARLRTDVGMTDFVYRAQWPGQPFADSLDQLRRFGEEVVPAVVEGEECP